jgi:hypothetical protein
VLRTIGREFAYARKAAKANHRSGALTTMKTGQRFVSPGPEEACESAG